MLLGAINRSYDFVDEDDDLDEQQEHVLRESPQDLDSGNTNSNASSPYRPGPSKFG